VLGTIPLVFLAEVGTAIALGVMLDTLIVRAVLVTALNLDLGRRIWWPSRLDSAPAPSVETPTSVADV
jgi:putative drug exporter of the RND superfamily